MVMGSSNDFTHSGVAGDTAMTSEMVSFYFLLDS
jgi:hypothetical protein